MAVSGAKQGAAGFTDPQALGRIESLAGAAELLPAYMVPSVVVGVRVWPRTSSGKIDRKRLPSPSFAVADATSIVAPASALE
eukprot:2654884-Prymnesium_polylepis.1